MRKQGGTPSWRDKHVTLAAISLPGVARGRYVGGHQSGLAGCKSPPLFKRILLLLYYGAQSAYHGGCRRLHTVARVELVKLGGCTHQWG